MVSKKIILNTLPQYKNQYAHIGDNQSVGDIIKAIKSCHKDFTNDYDKIAPFFIGSNNYQTCENIFYFLRDNVKYFIESEEEQTVKSPAAILKTGEIDCKGFALFSCGVLDAINRSGLQKIPYCYRFVSDSIFSTTPNHVFCVAFPGTANEIWIDPIPQVSEFNDKIVYYYSLDKKFSAMSLYKVSGFENRIGFTIPGVGVNTDDVLKLGSVLVNLFSKKGNPNDWQGWKAQDISYGEKPGFSAASWTLKDGDSVQNEALNIVQWIKNYGIDTVLTNWQTLGKTVTIDDLANKLTRGGFPTEAQQFKQQYNSFLDQVLNLTGFGTPSTSGTPAAPGTNTKAGMNMFVTIGLVGAAAFFLLNKKK